MARGRKSTDEHIIRQMFILHGDGMTPNKIAERLKIAPNTVRAHLKDNANIERYGELLSEIKQVHAKSNKEVIELINANRYEEILGNALNLLTKENMQKDFDKSGLRNIINLQGNIIDKLIKLKELELRKLEAERKESIHLHIDNNIGSIVELMNNPIPMTVDPLDEIKEFKQ